MTAAITNVSAPEKTETSIKPERDSPPRLFLAGAGAAGSAIARALHAAGWPLGELACRSVERARMRQPLIGGGVAVDFATLADPGRSAGEAPVLLLVAVPDRHIGTAAQALANRHWPPGSVALHLSGSAEVEALAPLERAGLFTGGFHPLKSFVDPARDAATLAGTVVAVEGSPPALAVAGRLAAALQLCLFRLEPGTRPAWHAAATHACNHLVALLDQALDLLATAGLPRDAARAALLPLLRGTLDNLATHAPGAALTGPVVRGDVSAVKRHLHALSSESPDVLEAYRALAWRALMLARAERRLDPDLAAELEAALARESS